MEIEKPGYETKPEYVIALENAYGAPNQEGFGSAVFFEQADPDDNLEALAQKYYRHFVGDLWERWGADAWLSPWKEAYARPPEGEHDIVAELRSIEDSDTQSQVVMILDVIQDAEEARKALIAAYDPPGVVDLNAYNLGDGEAVSGLLLAGRRKRGEVTLLVFLYD